jgi:hypothetical protein
MKKATLAALFLCCWAPPFVFAQEKRPEYCQDNWAYRESLFLVKEVCFDNRWKKTGPDRIFLRVLISAQNQKSMRADFAQLDFETTQYTNKKRVSTGEPVITNGQLTSVQKDVVTGEDVIARIWITPEKKLAVTLKAQFWFARPEDVKRPYLEGVISDDFILDQNAEQTKTYFVDGEPVTIFVLGAVDKNWRQ